MARKVALMLLALAATARADGKFVSTQVPVVEIPDQQAILVWKDGRERLVIDTAFVGEGDLAWIVPLPAPPKIEPVVGRRAQNKDGDQRERFSLGRRPDEVFNGRMEASIRELWTAGDERQWRDALDHYWDLTRPSNADIEREMEELTPAMIAAMAPDEWVTFLRTKYFRWKYTAPNRYATTTRSLDRQVKAEGVERLDGIRRRMLGPTTSHLGDRLRTVMEIKGLGPAGASGLLALLYPATFGTVDQFVVKALKEVEDLPERELLVAMDPEGLNASDAVVLILILQRKARELNEVFGSTEWTPRKVEMVLWSVGRT